MRRVFYPMTTSTKSLLSQRRLVEIAPEQGVVSENTSGVPAPATTSAPESEDDSPASTSVEDDGLSGTPV